MRRIRNAIAALLLATAAACSGSAPAGPTTAPPATVPPSGAADRYLNEIFALMQANSVNRLRIDWTAFQSQVRAQAPNAATIADTFPAIQLALQLLDDHHSFYIKASTTEFILNPSSPRGCGVADVPDVPDPVVPADVGYVRIAGFSGPGADEFATSIQNAIRTRDVGTLAGWIVDLRGNGGGNMWPMLAGVGPVLGTGVVGFFVPPEGVRRQWTYSNGAAMDQGITQSRVATPYELRRPSPRVAVLTDKGVASSGEAIAVAFRGRPDARTFGTSTCGVPTANRGFPLTDGATLVLTTALDADRTMVVYNSPLPPDETIADPSAVAARAIDWIRGGS